jgi:nicotinamidase/pyrazinamidase
MGQVEALVNAPDKDKPALLIIDMVKDTFDPRKNFPITSLAMKIIEPVKAIADVFRNHGWPVVFATDAFKEEDFIFTGRMKPYSLAGTPGAEVIEELGKKDEDLWLPKPRFSAFFRTDLDDWLKDRGVTLCAVAGITTNFCVLTTALDALCCDFKAVILEDCTMASSEKIHKQTVDTYRRSALYPLLRVAASTDFMAELHALE